MPAHCSAEDVGTKRLSDGSLLTEADVRANALVDKLAKAAALRDRLPSLHTSWARGQWDRLTAIAIWIGQATVLAQAFPAPRGVDGSARERVIRDNEGRQGRGTAVARAGQGGKRKPAVQPTHTASRPAGDLAGCERWEALRRRIIAKGVSRSGEASEPARG